MQLSTPKVIFCSEQPVNVILSTIKESNCNSTIVIFGDHPNAIPFSDVLSAYSDTEVANFRYVEPDDVKQTTCIALSSGTTGMPKGVELSNYCLMILNAELHVNVKNAVSLWFSPLYWVSGIMLNLKSIVHGFKVLLCPDFDEETTCLMIEKYKVRVIKASGGYCSW